MNRGRSGAESGTDVCEGLTSQLKKLTEAILSPCYYVNAAGKNPNKNINPVRKQNP